MFDDVSDAMTLLESSFVRVSADESHSLVGVRLLDVRRWREFLRIIAAAGYVVRSVDDCYFVWSALVLWARDIHRESVGDLSWLVLLGS